MYAGFLADYTQLFPITCACRMPFPLAPICRAFRIRTSAAEVDLVRENEVGKVLQLPGIIDVSFGRFF